MYNCEGCCFAQTEDKKQVGCLAGKHKYLTSSENSENNFFELNRICLYKRVEDWESDKTTEEKLEVAKQQLTPNIGICIDDDSDDPNDLEAVVNKVINLDYPRGRIKVVIYSHFNKAGARIPGLLTKMRSAGVNCWSVFIVQNNTAENETSVFTKLAEATFLARLSSKTKTNLQKTVEVINTKTNDELAPVLVFKNEDGVFINKTYVSRFYLEYLDYNKMQEAILNKVDNTEYLYNIT
jgi:hypothetical protein